MELDILVNLESINAFVQKNLHFSSLILDQTRGAEFSKATIEDKILLICALMNSGDEVGLEDAINAMNFSELDARARTSLAFALFRVFCKKVGNQLVPAIDTGRYQYLQKILARISPANLLSHELGYQENSGGLVELDYDSRISKKVTGSVFFREFILGPGSRRHEMGHRIWTSLSSQGWTIDLHNLEGLMSYSAYGLKDVVFIDAFVFNTYTADVLIQIFEGIRKKFSKVIIVELDSWAGTSDQSLQSCSELIDYIWGFNVNWRPANSETFKDRTIVFPALGGFDHISQWHLPAIDWDACSVNFTGSVMGYNFNRIYWILELFSRSIPVKIYLTEPSIDDGLGVEESLTNYAMLLASTNASVNFTTRPGGDRIMTGRSSEVISLARLLLQESCPVFNCYYVEGEHFFEFTNFEGLVSLIDFLKSHPKTAQLVCKNGHDFYLSRYSSRKLVQHLQTWL